MILIGMLHHRKNPKSVRKAYAYAVVAKGEGTDFIFFSPKSVNFDKKTISGFQYKNGQWVNVESRFPDVIYNAGSPLKLKKSQIIVNKLKQIIPFTSFSIGDKLRVYEKLKLDGEFSQYLVQTEVIKSIYDIEKFLTTSPKVVIKPSNGHRGQGVIYLEKLCDKYYLQVEKQNYIFKHKDFVKYIYAIIKEQNYIVQPYINSRTKDNRAYDFRLHVQKNGNNEWIITAIYPRIGPSGSIVTNINNGGYTNYLTPFLKQEFGDKFIEIKQHLETFSLKIARKMEEIQLKNYKEEIDELGIDIGIDEMRKIWIYEINWRPGCPPAFYLELDVVKNMINYCIYLANGKN